MTFQKLIASALLLSAIQLQAQQKFDVTMENGEKKSFIMEYDDPLKTPTWHLTLHPISIMNFGPESEGIGSSIKYEHRINPRLLIDGIFAFEYLSATKGIALGGHYSVWSRIEAVEKKTAFDFHKYSGSGASTISTVYTVKIPRNIRYSWEIDLGIGSYTSEPKNTIAFESKDPEKLGSPIEKVNVVMINVGPSIYMSQSYRMNTDGVQRAYFRYSRIHANLLCAVNSSYSTYAILPQNDNDIPPKFSRLGFKIGAEKHWGLLNSGRTVTIGYSVGYMPAYNFTNGFDDEGPAYFGLVNFGMGFGQNIHKKNP